MTTHLSNDPHFFLVLTVLLGTVACTQEQPQQRSTIVERVKQAGAGDVASASAFSLDDWMSKHRDLAVEVDKMCVPAREKGDAQWGNTTEAKVCVAARNGAMSTYRSPRDGKGYHSGNN
jgi:hypothetical protein